MKTDHHTTKHLEQRSRNQKGIDARAGDRDALRRVRQQGTFTTKTPEQRRRNPKKHGKTAKGI